MASPNKLAVRVINVAGDVIPGSQVAIVVRKGNDVLDGFTAAPSPRAITLKDGFVQIDITATAPSCFDETATLLFGVAGSGVWTSTNASWRLTESSGAASIDVVLGRIRYAPVTVIPDTQQLAVNFVAPGIVLDTRPNYRMYWPDVEVKMMVVRRPAIGSPTGREWAVFNSQPVKLKVGNSGNWLFLEYGDPEVQGTNVRFLLGVWAPYSVAQLSPPVVVFLTPNPTGGREGSTYPIDRFPFTGIYPFGMLPTQLPEKVGDTVPAAHMHQRYADLALDRSLTTWRMVNQIYAARPDLFSGPNGPIIITTVPAALNDGTIQRAPMSHREGIGRMVAEVLRFLWSRRLTLVNGTGSLRLLFPGSGSGTVKEISVGRTEVAPDGFPAHVTATLLTHSAGAGALLTLAGYPIGDFPKGFDRTLWGGCRSYGENDWKGIWLMDGVGRNKDGPALYQPTPGSPAVAVWKQWVKAVDNRRFVAVYCEVGLDGNDVTGLVDNVRRTSTKSGWIEEAQSNDKRIAWLRTSNSNLAQVNPTQYPEVVPVFGARKPHDFVFEFGVGYAAGLPLP